MAINKINTRSIQDTTVTSDDIQDNAITNAKVSPSAAIAQSKVSGLASSISTLCSSISTTNTNVTALNNKIGTAANNIGLLGFKMAVNDGLTVFNLIDGVVDEFHDESGTDEGEGSNDLYNATDDYYINSSQPTGQSASFFAGFGSPGVTEADTSPVATANPTNGTILTGTYTVPTSVTNVGVFLFGAGGGASAYPGGGGGMSKGCLAVTPGQSLYVSLGEGGMGDDYTGSVGGGGGTGSPGYGSPGGGMTIISSALPGGGPGNQTQGAHPGPVGSGAYFIAAGGGGGADGSPQGHGGGDIGGAGASGNSGPSESPSGQTSANGIHAGGGDQEQGGQGGTSPDYPNGNSGSPLQGGNGGPSGGGGGGGGGYFGGGGGARTGSGYGRGGGGSSYIGHPQVSNGDTISVLAADAGASYRQTECAAQPCQAKTDYRPLGTPNPHNGFSGDGAAGSPSGPPQAASDGYGFIYASLPATTTATTIVSNAFAAGTVPTTSRIVVFEENVATPTLNTDIIASISRDGGSNFTSATLADSGYVTGSSGQRILTGQATISGQPSGQSMRWKLALANNTVKIHGVALQWS